MSFKGTGLESESPTRAREGAADEGLEFREGPSFMVFHSPQTGQRPIHLDVSFPQEVQYQTVLALEGMADYPS